MGAKTGVNERELLGSWIVHGELPPAALKGKQDRRRMGRPFLAEGWVVAWTNSGGDPHSSFFIEHWIVHVGAAIPNGFVSPIRRRNSRLVVCARWSLWIAHSQFDLTRRGPNWIQHRQVIHAEFCGPIDWTIGIQRRIALNANGPIYGAAELSVDYLPVLDPVGAP